MMMTTATVARVRSARILRVIGYVSIAAAGTLLAIALPLGTADGVYVILCAWMGLGGLICAMGTAFDRWIGEFGGLPLLGTAMLAFAILTIRDNGWTSIGVANLLLLAGLGLLFLARWRDVAAVYRSAAKAAPGRQERA